MKARKGLVAFAIVVGVVAIALMPAEQPAPKRPGGQKGQPKTLELVSLKITGPHTHENLAVFLIHGQDRIKDKKFLSLQEALKQKKLVIHETGNVNRLTVENTGDVTVYIQSGEIIKGGKQDRMLQYDYIVPPRSGKQPVSSFCVESGRWRRRGNEAAANFASSSNAVIGNAMRLAAKLEGNQGTVWREVTKAQNKLGGNVGASVRSGQSPSSLQLSLESKKLKEAAAAYQQKLANVIKKHKDAIGFAVAINGQVNNVDVYASHDLFAKLWPKLLETSAFEAIADLKKGAKFDHPAEKDVRKFVAEVDQARARQKKIASNATLMIRATTRAASFETRGEDEKELHRSYHLKQK